MASTAVGQPATQGPVQPGAQPLPGATTGIFGSGGEFNWSQTLASTTSLAGSIGTIAGSFGAIESGRQASSQFQLQAGSQETQADVIRLNAIERGNALRRRLLADLGSANASAAARGIDTGSGTPRQIVEESIATVQSDVAKLERGAEIGATGTETSASRSRAAGAAREYQGYLRAGMGLVSGALR